MQSKTRYRLELSGAACLLALVLTNCSDDASTGASVAGAAGSTNESAGAGGAGDAGTAGQGTTGISGAAGQTGLEICGMPDALSECDPTTASPCDIAAGETCDHSATTGGYKCFPPPNEGLPGRFCDNNTVYCGAKTVCDTDKSVCVHFCCVASDCLHGDCTTVYTDGTSVTGACLAEYPAAAGDAGAGGAGN